MHLHSRIFILVLLMLLGLGGTSTAFLYQSAQQRVEADVADRLVLAERSFADAFDNRQQNLMASVQTVVNDWGLRTAIGQGDRSTVESVLFNHSTRVGADLAIFIDKEQRLYASTIPVAGHLSETITALAASTGSASQHRFTVIDGRCYQLVMTEVRAPVPVGWLGMGFLIDDSLAKHFSRLNDVGVSFIEPSATNSIMASSLSDKERIKSASTVNADDFWRVRGVGWEDLVMHHVLDSADSSLVVILQKSLSEPLAGFRSWWWSLLTIFALIALLALLVAWVFSRGITKPLTQLLFAIENMEAGNYSTSVEVHRNDEIGFLSKAFTRMQKAIAEREDEIRYRADHDLVTGIHNRNGFIDSLERQIVNIGGSGDALVVLCFSLNHFRQIVDALGHTWGDRLLKMVSERLQTVFPDSFVAHVDSDEFALIMSSNSVPGFYSFGEQIHECLKDEFSIRGISLTLTACVGVSVYPEHASDARSLLRRAGVALNEALQNHQRTIVYDPDLDQNSVKRLTLMSELPNAIRMNQLELHFQPKIRCAEEGAVVDGAECLVRWNHPELGWIAPDEFIGLAEKTGYIVELTRFVLSEAVSRCSDWRRQNWDLSVAVNISALDLTRDDFAREVHDLLQTHRLPPDALCLEVTESTAMEDPETAIHRLTALKKLGVRLSIDDYGTGYSSLAQLKKLPVHELKIDKSFVLELDRNEDDQTIVRSTIELAHNVGLEVVAEGVESQRIFWQLEQWGCERIQGFHISKPLSLPEFEDWLRNSPYNVLQLSTGKLTKLTSSRW